MYFPYPHSKTSQLIVSKIVTQIHKYLTSLSNYMYALYPGAFNQFLSNYITNGGISLLTSPLNQISGHILVLRPQIKISLSSIHPATNGKLALIHGDLDYYNYDRRILIP